MQYIFRVLPPRSYFRARLLPLYIFFLALEFIGTAAKIFTAPDFDWSIAALLKLAAFGWAETTAAYFWAVLPLVFFYAFLPKSWQQARLGRWLAAIFLYLWLFVIVLSRTAEWLFWREFEVSFNFIAVDYLIYTSEMLLNIWQTFPVVWLLLFVAVAAAAVFFWLRKKEGAAGIGLPSFFFRVSLFFFVAACTYALFHFIDARLAERISSNRYNQEAAKNDLYSFGSAFLSNDLSYDDFYLKNDAAANAKLLRTHYARTGEFVEKNDSLSLRRHVAAKNTAAIKGEATGDKMPSPEFSEIAATPKNLNVVFVIIESLGWEFLGEAGLYDDLTPNLDRLTKSGLYFSKTYATGTRTVRGLEAAVLSLPPQTGMSVIRQRDNGNLYGTGEIFRQAGYAVKWIYGGYGYFDNMNDFFAANGFDIVDRLSLDEAKIHHQTAWGVADEDLFTKALEEADVSYAKGEKFFQLVLTTSNHSPYTYPAGRVKIPAGTGREGAVSYTDYAIGDFLQRAKEKPWFSDTVFVFLGDHGAKAAGKMELNPEKHRVVFVAYAPGHIAPRRIDYPISQIDAVPTLLGLLNWSYDSSFYGEDALAADYVSRYFLSNYQYIGYADEKGLAVLKPVRQVVYYMNEKYDDAASRQALLDTAIAYYQHGAKWREHLKKR